MGEQVVVFNMADDTQSQPKPAREEHLVAQQSPSSDPATRILKKGDLVRIAERREPGLKNRDGGLGRIHRSIPVTEEDAASAGQHPFRYDVDVVLGGRITNVDRTELLYTTPDAEGMTERRKRNPTVAVKEAQETEGLKPPKAKKKSKPGTKKVTAKKGKASAGAKHKGKNAVASKKTAKVKEKKEEDTVVVKDLFAAHKRDFEKCLTRLERQDTYAFFLGDPPPENDEDYSVGNGAQNSASDLPATPPPLVCPPVFPSTAPYNFSVIRKRHEHGRYILDRVRQHKERTFSSTAPELIHPKGINWDVFRDDVVQMCGAAIARDPDGGQGGKGTLGAAAIKIKNHVLKLHESNGKRQMKEMEDDEARHKFYNAIRSKENSEAAVQGKWRTTAFPERIYERLSSNVVCAGLSSLDERTAVYELQTSLPDSFVGLSYSYTDTGQSEGWMKSVLDDTKGNDNAAKERKAALDLANDDGVVRAQVEATMAALLIGVQDRVMTDFGVLRHNELKSANWAGDIEEERSANESVETASDESPDIVEQPVWGIDCYTRRNITSCIEKDFDSSIALEFIEKWLLPAINACPAKVAHNMIFAARILEGLSLPSSTNLEEDHADDSGDERWSHSLLGKALKDKMAKVGPVWLKSVAHQLRLAISTLGHDFFRVHPKGHGAIVLKPKLKANTLVTFYRGEVYPSWRWGEKMDAIDLTQNRLGLRPNLPDFYNMALERPQVDPRGYGLLFVDASRKAGHGSSLSHSCEPTCEVRVAAVDGQLCLAMTTIRELELGEELTFDYNAVTESLNEYQSAVCLCGHGRCRGSFLHFATADCYQEVLNRNSPIAVRFSNLIKGCAKQVMSDADEELLATHGFGTAAFGAVSLERTEASSNSEQQKLDSMQNVPIWLRTYVADTLRYIEYERRALPVMLLCNHLKSAEAKAIKERSRKSLKNRQDVGNDLKPRKKKRKSEESNRPIPGSKPEPVFLFFSRKRADFFRSQLDNHGLSKLTGLELQRAMMKVASCCWKALSDEMKQYWKDQAVVEWKESGGPEKARLEAERLKSIIATNENKRKPNDDGPDGAVKAQKKRKSNDNKETNVAVNSSQLSFQAADAEGVSAMEQRIQQLTQTLSRVGRVLDRHKESSIKGSSQNTDNATEIHSPLSNLSDNDVVYWLWQHEDGPVRSLLRSCNNEKCLSPSILESLKATQEKYSNLLKVEAPPQPLTSEGTESKSGNRYPANARTIVTDALLEFRTHLCNGLVSLEGELRQHELENKRRKDRARREARKKMQQDAEKTFPLPPAPESLGVRATVGSILDSMVDTVVERAENGEIVDDTETLSITDTGGDDSKEDSFPLSPWLECFAADRWKLEAVADLLLFYAHTKTYFAIMPYAPLESTPIEVYARELGNEVPRSVVETAHEKRKDVSNDFILLGANIGNPGIGDDLPGKKAQSEVAKESTEEGNGAASETHKAAPRSKSRALCQPDDIITNVTITYRGDYVLSQLLQWYNGGIGQKPGLPDLIGCVLLPPLEGPLKATLGGKTAAKHKPSRYASEVRPMLLEWLNDPRKRGSPFEDLLSQVFPGWSSTDKHWGDPKFSCAPVGSPVLDLLIAGDDSSLRSVAVALAENIRSTNKSNGSSVNGITESATDRLQSTVDEGMPAQAVANWVQCEHPDCLKWRKVPWHVDVDALPEKFYCSDNKWNPAVASCDAPEDTWDECDAQLQNGGVVKEIDAEMTGSEAEEPQAEGKSDEPTSARKLDAKKFVIGARFDIRRHDREYFSTGEVVNVDFSGTVKRVLFHVPKTKAIYDEWIEIDSPRIAPLNTKQDPNSKPKRSAKKKKKTENNVAHSIDEQASMQGPSVPVQQSSAPYAQQQHGTSTNTSSASYSRAQLLKQMAAAALASARAARGVSVAEQPPILGRGARPAYPAAATVHSDGRVSMQLSTCPQLSPIRSVAPSGTQSSPSPAMFDAAVNDAQRTVSTMHGSYSIPRKAPQHQGAGTPSVASVQEQTASYTIRHKEAPQRSDGNLVDRIPRETKPAVTNPDLNGASLLFGMSANGLSRSQLQLAASHYSYFPPNQPDHAYQARVMQGRYPMPLPSQYFDARNYWQGQQQQQQQHHGGNPRQQYGGPPDKKQHDDQR